MESDHPYPEATVLHYQTVLSDSVSWMVAEFSPESGIGPDDSLEIYVSEVFYLFLCLFVRVLCFFTTSIVHHY